MNEMVHPFHLFTSFLLSIPETASHWVHFVQRIVAVAEAERNESVAVAGS
jgi:hypothetical protein